MNGRVQGGFNNQSGTNQSAQKQQVTLPVNCFLVNQIKNGNIEQSNSNHFEWYGPFENCIITAKYELISESGQNKIEGRLSDNTGNFAVITQKPRDSDQMPEFLQEYQNQLNMNGNKIMYVRAMIKMRKTSPVQLVYFSIVHDANEITRHNLDIALRFMQRSVGFEDFMEMVAKKPVGEQNQRNAAFKIDKTQPAPQQILQYFKAMSYKNGGNNQIPKKELMEFFKPDFNAVQMAQYLQSLVQSNDIMYFAQTENYFLSE